MAEKKRKEEAVCPVCNTMSIFYDHRVGHEGGAWGEVVCAACGAIIIELSDPPPRNKVTCPTCGAVSLDYNSPPPSEWGIKIDSNGFRFYHFVSKDIPRPISPELLARLQKISDIAVEREESRGRTFDDMALVKLLDHRK